VLHELSGDGLSVLDDLGSVLLEFGSGSLLESDGDTGDGLHSIRESELSIRLQSEGLRTDVVVRSTLASREDGIVDTLLNVGLLVLAEEDETSTGTTKSLVAVYT